MSFSTGKLNWCYPQADKARDSRAHVPFGGGRRPCYVSAPRVQRRDNEQFPPGRKPEAAGHGSLIARAGQGEEGTGTWQLEL